MTQGELLAALAAVLAPLVGGRCYTRAFPQRAPRPTWPAIRLSVISQTTVADACGGGDDDVADVRIQVDVVTLADEGEGAHQVLRRQVKTAVAGLGPEYVWDGEHHEADATTQTFRTVLDCIVYLSSDATP